MSRCRQTDAILDATFAGAGLTRDQGAHVTVCAECARALSDARRFDATLERIGLELAPEPAPPVADLLSVGGSQPKGGRLMTARNGLIGGAAVVVVIGAIAIGGRWLTSGGTVDGIGSAPAAVALSGELNGWLQDAENATDTSTGGTSDDTPLLVRAEECGRDYTAVLQGDGGREFYWVSGPKEDGSQATGGISRSLYSVEVARDLAAEGALCERIVEATISRADAAAAVERMGGIPGDAQVEAASLLEPGTAMVVMEGSVNFWSDAQWWVGLLHKANGEWSGSVDEWIGTNTPEMTGGLRVIGANTILRGAPATDVLVAVLPDVAVAVELDIDGVPHRYPANPGEGMLIIALPDVIERPTAVRFIGPDGDAFGEHIIGP